MRGWELPAAGYGTIQSFSDPTLPRVMAINISYGPGDEPRLCPFCFTWLGHELGHTKSYLIETILHVRGESLTTNQSDYTDVLPRYGRALSLRTVLQVPYTHLYEWTLLMDFVEGAFAGLPWRSPTTCSSSAKTSTRRSWRPSTKSNCAAQLTPCGLRGRRPPAQPVQRGARPLAIAAKRRPRPCGSHKRVTGDQDEPSSQASDHQVAKLVLADWRLCGLMEGGDLFRPCRRQRSRPLPGESQWPRAWRRSVSPVSLAQTGPGQGFAGGLSSPAGTKIGCPPVMGIRFHIGGNQIPGKAGRDIQVGMGHERWGGIEI